jgi:Zn-dependent M28 family amino/carboxypeptidase
MDGQPLDRNADGVWDFGAKVSKSFYFPLSDDWRKAGNRSVDHSTRILALLRQFSGEYHAVFFPAHS